MCSPFLLTEQSVALVVQSLTSRRSATHNCNGLSNLAYFLLVFTFPEGQKKTNKEWRSCFSSRLASGWPSSGCHVSLCGGWRVAGPLRTQNSSAGVGCGWLEVLFAVPLHSRQPLWGGTAVFFFPLSGSKTLFSHLLTQLVWAAPLCSSYQPAMHIPMTLQQCHDAAAAAQHRDAAIYCT